MKITPFIAKISVETTQLTVLIVFPKTIMIKVCRDKVRCFAFLTLLTIQGVSLLLKVVHLCVLGSVDGIPIGYTDDGVLCSTLWVPVGTTLGIDDETELGSSDGVFDGSNDGIPEGLFLGDSPGSYDGAKLGSSDGDIDRTKKVILEVSKLGVPLGYSDGFVIGYNEGIILSSDVGEVIGSTLGIDEGTNPGSSDGSFDGSNESTLEG